MLYDIANAKYKLDDFKKIEISRKLTTAIRLLVRDEELKNVRVPGEQGFYYGLPTWFSSTGKVSSKHLGNLSPDKQATKKKSKPTGNSELQYFILKSLTAFKQISTLDDFLEAAKAKFKFTEKERSVFAANISETLDYLLAEGEVRRMRTGSIGVYEFALTKWFNKNGELGKSYHRK